MPVPSPANVPGVELGHTSEFFGLRRGDDWHFSLLTLFDLSAHVELGPRLLWLIGCGVGALYEGGDDLGFAVKPRLGLDILVGRSGILRPAVFLMWSTIDLVDLQGETVEGRRILGGLEIGYAVMF